MRRWLAFVLISVLGFGQQKHGILSNEAKTARLMEQLRADPQRLHEFLKEMPKGGDLHNHLSGAVYAESYMQWAADEGDCIDAQALSIIKPLKPDECVAGQVTAKSALTNPKLYGDLLGAMSMYQWLPEKWHDTGHDHFFNAFPKFATVSKMHWGEMLKEVTGRAAEQHEIYMELILGIDRNEAGAYGEKIEWSEADFAADYERLLQSGLKDLVPRMRKSLDEAEKQRLDTQGCKEVAQHGCDITVRYEYEVYRGAAPAHVFAQMLAGFELASQDPRVVTVNLVQPEDWYVSEHDYRLHMRMVEFFHTKYPKVRIALHAGEIAPGLVPDEVLCCHIREAIETGHAGRIGHGADIMYENDPDALLHEMASKHIPVEINLTSNRVILGVSGTMHPLRGYLRAGVPVVLCTDDEGVARSDMTNELMQAVLDQVMTYHELKQAERNSIQYSFADEKTKKKLMEKLEANFVQFERVEADRQARNSKREPGTQLPN
ncbi:MAG: adenosine deaminase [Acidobacteriales bacterium]|nr:adenosine deaminase [Terriglobales bacterium]